MLIGPLFTRELVTAPRRAQHFISRTVYVAALFVVMCTAWLVITGTQEIRNASDMGRFGAMIFQLLAPLQTALLAFNAALRTASYVSLEKDKKTLLLLLMTRLTNSELVLGKLLASILDCLAMALAALPLFLLTTLLGGVSLEQTAKAYAVTLSAVFLAASVGVLIGYWREKTFQSLALTALTLVAWTAAWEGAAAAFGSRQVLGLSVERWAVVASPARAILSASRPHLPDPSAGWIADGVPLHLIVSPAMSILLVAFTIAMVRVWNPSREARPAAPEEEGALGSIWAQHDAPVAEGEDAIAAMRKREQSDAARAGHVDARVRTVSRKHREVWDNPILWREMCTWAYGRKVVLIRLMYLLFAATAGYAVYEMRRGGALFDPGEESLLPAAARPLAPFFFVSLTIINALAVTSLTNERDSGALDLLMVTDLSPREFLLGKLGGVAYVAKEMIVVPIVLCGVLWWTGGITGENLVYFAIGLLVLDAFAIMLGLHCGMHYASSRSSIGVSLGTLFFLFVGVVTLLVMMVSFSGNFQTQLGPFLAFIVGGSAGLFVALGSRNPSQAIAMASILLPFCTFFAITSFLLGHSLQVLLVAAGAYGFTTLAMMLPALGEFDFAMGRSRTDNE